MATKTKTPKAPAAPRVSLSDSGTSKAPIETPSLWRNVKAFGKKHVVKPIKERQIQEKARAIAINFHAIPTRNVAERSYEAAERLSGEISGAVAGVTRMATAGVVAFAAGLVTGTRGISPTALKQLRLNPEGLIPVGSWKHVETVTNKDGDQVEELILDLVVDIRTGEPNTNGTEFTAPLRVALNDTLVFDKVDRPVLIFPYSHGNTVVGLLVAINDETDRRTFLWIDGVKPTTA
jgi:hypothetical protein